jgi:hypothetical protein
MNDEIQPDYGEEFTAAGRHRHRTWLVGSFEIVTTGKVTRSLEW